jgi:hypothetical protein
MFVQGSLSPTACISGVQVPGVKTSGTLISANVGPFALEVKEELGVNGAVAVATPVTVMAPAGIGFGVDSPVAHVTVILPLAPGIAGCGGNGEEMKHVPRPGPKALVS